MFDYSAIIHFHSEYSHDGRASIAEILSAARENGIDILMLTDHENLQARLSGQEGWHENVLLISGEEICPAQFNHYLAFGHAEPLSGQVDEQTPPQEIINRVNAAGGWGIIAHPDHEGTEMFHVKQYAWKEWPVSGFAALGIWDFMTDWQASLTGNMRAVLSYLFPALFLKGPRRVTLERWDSLNRTGRVPGVAELDNHDTPWQGFGLTWSVFPFRKAFRFIRNHFLLEKGLTGRKEKDIPAIYEAVRAGRVYLSLEHLAPARGFTFSISVGDRVLQLGDEAPLGAAPNGRAVAAIKTPFAGLIRLLKDGRVIAERTGDSLELSLDAAGVYRVEVYFQYWGEHRPWIFSNPICLR